ncbi:MAG TPA: lytic transglycosylase domain-containing protein [Terriglobales bacterium]|nr:lytic transglycosylase domain-containing protein [Terriglobales bacterium]
MRKHLQIALMATPVLAASLSLCTPHVFAADDAPAKMVATTDDSGRTVYTNDVVTLAKGVRNGTVSRRSGLVYWSDKEKRFKPVPSATMGAARSAAAEVNQYLTHESNPEDAARSNFVRSNTPISQQDVDAAIEQAAARHNVDPNLVRSVIKVESNFNPNAVSRKGAMGLMQLMPSTARSLHVTNPFDPQQNVDAGVRHLKSLLESYGGNIKLSLAAYNAGAGAVARSSGVPRFAETQNYVRRITEIYYGGGQPGSRVVGNVVHDPVRVQRDARGVLYISNTD